MVIIGMGPSAVHSSINKKIAQDDNDEGSFNTCKRQEIDGEVILKPKNKR